MADVTGPISSLPGSEHKVPDGTLCGDHPQWIAVKRVQGETDSFGSEMVDMCQYCYDTYLQHKSELHVGHCDWCKQPRDDLAPTRDVDEGSAGPVYKVCTRCRRKQMDVINEELEQISMRDMESEPNSCEDKDDLPRDTVTVRFPMTPDVWNKVVVESKEAHCVEEEGTEHFVIEYASREDFHNAITRFEGLIAYTKI